MRSSSNKKESRKKQKFCLHDQCSQEANLKGFCRLHYIANWRELKTSQKQKSEKRLNAYVDRMAERYPKDYMDRIREGLGDETKFRASLDEMEVDGENSENDQEFLEKFLRDIKVDSE